MTKKIAFATCENAAVYAADDHALSLYLQNQGFEVSDVVWNKPEINWEEYDMVLIRSTWDYHQHIEAWKQWLQMLTEKKVKVWNPAETILWNMHKTYLKDLEQKGIQIVPTIFVERGENANLKEILEEQNWWKAVVKPAISLDAFQTWQTDLATAELQQANFEALVAKRDVMIQPFMPEIQTTGEYSFMFFGGEYSHTVLKSNPTGDFRIQENYGGLKQLVFPSPSLISQTQSILQSIDLPQYYVRVDVIERSGELFLMEIELIEPSLFLGLYEPSIKHLGDLIKINI